MNIKRMISNLFDRSTPAPVDNSPSWLDTRPDLRYGGGMFDDNVTCPDYCRGTCCK
jgi:hypothetical protein